MMDVYEKIQIKSNVDNTTPQMPATVAEMVTYEDNKNSEEVRADLEKSVGEINAKMLTKDNLKITKGRTHFGSDATEYLEYLGEFHEFATGDFVDYFTGFESTAVTSTTMDNNFIWLGTKAEYDALDEETKATKNLFITTDEPYADLNENTAGGVDVTLGNNTATLAKQSDLFIVEDASTKVTKSTSVTAGAFYMYKHLGLVQFSGDIVASPSVNTEMQVATLPAGYRPAVALTTYANWGYSSQGGVPVRVTISADGRVLLYASQLGASGSAIRFGISFISV